MKTMIARRVFLAVMPVLFLAGPVSAETRIADSRGEQVFETVPQRVVVLNWSLAEQLIELDLTPVGIADPGGYRDWVARPPLPEGVADVGKRNAPNAERIAALAPDLILLGDDQEGLIPQLSAIAPVLQFQMFREDHDNAAAARRGYLDLGDFFGRRDLAESRLAAMDARLADHGHELNAAFDGTPPKVTIIRFMDDKRVVIYGANGMPEAAMAAMGLTSGYPVPASRWGLEFKPVTELAAIDAGLVLSIEPFAAADELFPTPLWQAMPFVQAGRFASLPPQWTYGGAMSIGLIGDAIFEALMAYRRQ